MCDDMGIETSIFFNEKKERVEGFEDNETERTDQMKNQLRNSSEARKKKVKGR